MKNIPIEKKNRVKNNTAHKHKNNNKSLTHTQKRSLTPRTHTHTSTHHHTQTRRVGVGGPCAADGSATGAGRRNYLIGPRSPRAGQSPRAHRRTRTRVRHFARSAKPPVPRHGEAPPPAELRPSPRGAVPPAEEGDALFAEARAASEDAVARYVAPTYVLIEAMFARRDCVRVSLLRACVRLFCVRVCMCVADTEVLPFVGFFDSFRFDGHGRKR